VTHDRAVGCHAADRFCALAKGRDPIEDEIERIRAAYESGRYVPCADHSIPPDVSFDDFRHYLDPKRRSIGKETEAS